MSDSYPYISVIIPTYKDWDRLKHCIDALMLQSYPKDRFEVVVVNNSSRDDFPSDLQHLEKISLQLLTEMMPGSYQARNTGLQHAKGEIIAFTDSDCQPDIHWLESAVEIFCSEESVDRIAGKIDIFRETHSSWAVWKFDSITAFNQRHNVRQGVSVTANLFVRKSVFDTVGQFNAEMMSGGDIEWGKRASYKGVSLIYSDKTVIKHPARSSWKELFIKTRRVTGGVFMKARQDGHLIKLFFWHFMPPVRYVKVLRLEEQTWGNVIYAALVFWVLKMLMSAEFIRLLCVGKPVR